MEEISSKSVWRKFPPTYSNKCQVYRKPCIDCFHLFFLAVIWIIGLICKPSIFLGHVIYAYALMQIYAYARLLRVFDEWDSLFSTLLFLIQYFLCGLFFFCVCREEKFVICFSNYLKMKRML